MLALLRFVLLRPGSLIAGAAVLFFWLVGTPHIGGSYTCSGSLHEGGGCGSYDSCTYYGVQGRRVVFPEAGEQCQLIRFLPVKWGQNSTSDEETPAWADTNYADDAYPLNESKINRLYWGVIMGRCMVDGYPNPRPACNHVFDLVRSREFTVIQCIYGPMNRDGTSWRFYYFWNNKVPDDLARFATPGEEHPFLALGTLTVPSCPETSDKAEALFQAGRIRG